MSASMKIKTEEVILEHVEYNSTEELDDELQLQLEDSGGESYQYQSDGQITTIHQQIQQQQQQQQHIIMKTPRQRHNNSHLNQSSAGNGNGGNGGGSGGGGGSGSDVIIGANAKQTSGTPSINNKSMDSEKRMRREIANSNERRRMQSINAGFQNLRSLLPRHEGEKLSKAAILQQTSAYICELENQKTQLLSQNSQLKRQLGQQEVNVDGAVGNGDGDSGGGGGGGGGGGENEGVEITVNDTCNVLSTNKKRKLTDNVVNVQAISDSSDEGLGSMSPEPMTLLSGTGGGGVVTATTIVAASTVASPVVSAPNNSKAQMFLAQSVAKEILELKEQLYKEKRLRTALEEELQGIKRQLITVATAPQPTVITDIIDTSSGTTTTYIPREVIEHTDNLLRDDCGPFTYVEIDELTGQEHMVVCSSVEELDNETAAVAAELITEDNIHEEVILSATSSTELEQESTVNAIAKVYAEGNSPNSAVLQPILQAAIKATPKVEVERITDTTTLRKVKTEKIEQTSGLARSRQNLETIVEAIRHLEGDHLFTDSSGEQHKVLMAQAQQHVAAAAAARGQEAPLALTTTKQNVAQRKTLAELRPFLQIKGGNQKVTILSNGGVGGGGGGGGGGVGVGVGVGVGGGISSSGGSGGGTSVGTALTLSKAGTAVIQTQKDTKNILGNSIGSTIATTTNAATTATAIPVTPTAIFKVQATNHNTIVGGGINSNNGNSSIITTTAALKQCRPGVIVAKQLS